MMLLGIGIIYMAKLESMLELILEAKKEIKKNEFHIHIQVFKAKLN